MRSNVIVGFPGETEADVAELERFLTAARLDAIGVFGYSDEDGTEAAALTGKLADDVIAERVEQLTELVDELIASGPRSGSARPSRCWSRRSTASGVARAGRRTRRPRWTGRHAALAGTCGSDLVTVEAIVAADGVGRQRSGARTVASDGDRAATSDGRHAPAQPRGTSPTR